MASADIDARPAPKDGAGETAESASTAPTPPRTPPSEILAKAIHPQDFIEVLRSFRPSSSALDPDDIRLRAWSRLRDAFRSLGPKVNSRGSYVYHPSEEVTIYRDRAREKPFGVIPVRTLVLALGGDSKSRLLLDVKLYPGGDLPGDLADLEPSRRNEYTTRIEHAGWVSAAAFRKMVRFRGGTSPGRVVPEWPQNERQLMALEEDARARGSKALCAFRDRLASRLAGVEEPAARTKRRILALCKDMAAYDGFYRGTQKMSQKQVWRLARRICAAARGPLAEVLSDTYAQAVLFGRHNAGGLTFAGSGHMPDCSRIR